jgi:hypothetical protein
VGIAFNHGKAIGDTLDQRAFGRIALARSEAAEVVHGASTLNQFSQSQELTLTHGDIDRRGVGHRVGGACEQIGERNRITHIARQEPDRKIKRA